MTIREMVQDINEKAKINGGINSVYFVACGGSWASQYPARYLLERESRTLKVGQWTSNEFVHAVPMGVGSRSLVILCSLMGTTETKDACSLAKKRGAYTLSFCGDPNQPMAQLSDYVVPFKSIAREGTLYMESNAAPQLLLAFEILQQMEGFPFYNEALSAFNLLEEVAAKSREKMRPEANVFAKDHKDDPFIYVLGGGPALGVSYGFCICSLMEMQWIDSAVINTGEFFHGPFEVIDEKKPLVLFVSEGRNREVDERCLSFLQKYAGRLTVVDARDLHIGDFPENVREYFNHFVFDAAQREILDQLAAERHHDKMQRRYMWKVPY